MPPLIMSSPESGVHQVSLRLPAGVQEHVATQEQLQLMQHGCPHQRGPAGQMQRELVAVLEGRRASFPPRALVNTDYLHVVFVCWCSSLTEHYGWQTFTSRWGHNNLVRVITTEE